LLSHRVQEQDVHVAWQFRTVGRDIESCKQFIFRLQFGGASQRLDQRRLSAVGVADDSDTRDVQSVSVFSQNSSLVNHRRNLLLQFSFASRSSKKFMFGCQVTALLTSTK